MSYPRSMTYPGKEYALSSFVGEYDLLKHQRRRHGWQVVPVPSFVKKHRSRPKFVGIAEASSDDSSDFLHFATVQEALDAVVEMNRATAGDEGSMSRSPEIPGILVVRDCVDPWTHSEWRPVRRDGSD